MCESHERLRDIQQYAIQLSDEARATVGQAADEIKRLMAKADNWQRIATEVTVSEHALRLDNERLEEEARNIHDQRLLDYEEIEQLRAALQALADDTSVPPWIRTLAHRALEPKP